MRKEIAILVYLLFVIFIISLFMGGSKIVGFVVGNGDESSILDDPGVILPAISIIKFDENTTQLPYVTKEIDHVIELYVDPASVCRISEEDLTFDQMDVNCIPEDVQASFISCSFSETSRSYYNEENPNGDFELFIVCKDLNNNKNTKKVLYRMAVALPDTNAPKVSGISVEELTNQSALIRWGTDEPANSEFYYGINESLFDKTITQDEFVVSHFINLTGLESNTTYYYNITCCDMDENCNLSGGFSFETEKTKIIVDKDPPIVSGIKQELNKDTVIISWVTDEESNFTLYYGDNKSKLDNKVVDSNFSLVHNVNLTGLDNKTTYYFKIYSVDKNRNFVESSVYTLAVFGGICKPEWECGVWSGCINKKQTRGCIDKNKCGSSDTKPDEEQECSECLENGDCEEGLVCVDGSCVPRPECESNDNCDQGEICDNNKCKPKSECETDSDCDDGVCIDSKCVVQDKTQSISMFWIMFWLIILIIFGGIGGSYYLYTQNKLPQLNFVFDQLDPLLRKIGLTKPKKQGISGEIEIDPLKSYIDQMKKAGYSDDQIYHNLLKYGYPPEKIKKYF